MADCWQRLVDLKLRELSERSYMETLDGQRQAEVRIRKLWAEAEAKRPKKIRPIPNRILREA